jgi:Protein of unknown function (DUF3307)
VAWVEIFAVLVVSHGLGDYMLQTDWQATRKRGGLGRDPVARRALFAHVTSYTLAFVPAGIWLADDMTALGFVALAAGIFIPHLVQDDGRLLTAYIKRVKGEGAANTQTIFTSVDQSLHLIVLFLTALVVHWATT